MEILKKLPHHNVPDAAHALARNPILRIQGLVAQPQTLTPADLLQLPHTCFRENFLCDGHWTVPDLRWDGPRLLDVLKLAEPLPEASYVRVGAGDYVVPLKLTEAEDALLATHLNNELLTVEHGAPWRLALFGGRCFTSVKWVDRLVLSAEPGENTSLQIVRDRNRARRAASRTTST